MNRHRSHFTRSSVQNILLDRYGNAKLTDFGLSVMKHATSPSSKEGKASVGGTTLVSMELTGEWMREGTQRSYAFTL